MSENLPVGKLRLWVNVLFHATKLIGFSVTPQFLVSPEYLQAVPFQINSTHSFIDTVSQVKINDAVPVLVIVSNSPGVASVGVGAVSVWPAVVWVMLKFEQISTVVAAVPIDQPVARFAIARVATLRFSFTYIIRIRIIIKKIVSLTLWSLHWVYLQYFPEKNYQQ
jgi:hypothetical protein